MRQRVDPRELANVSSKQYEVQRRTVKMEGQTNVLPVNCSHQQKIRRWHAYVHSSPTRAETASNVRAGSCHTCALNWRRLMHLTPTWDLSLGQILSSWEKKERKMRSQLPAGRAQSHWSGGSAPCSPCPPAEALPSLPAHPQFLSRSLMQSFPSGPGQPSLHPSASPGHGSALWNAGPLWLSHWWCSSAEGRGKERRQQERCRRNKILNFSGSHFLIEGYRGRYVQAFSAFRLWLWRL